MKILFTPPSSAREHVMYASFNMNIIAPIIDLPSARSDGVIKLNLRCIFLSLDVSHSAKSTLLRRASQQKLNVIIE